MIVGYAGVKQLRKRETGSGGLGFIDANGKRIGDIILDAHPESFQLEESGSRIFVNVPEKKEIEVVDASKGSALVRWPVSAEDNFPMALDEAHHRLFAGVWKPPSYWSLTPRQESSSQPVRRSVLRFSAAPNIRAHG